MGWRHERVIRGYRAPSGTVIVEAGTKLAVREERVSLRARLKRREQRETGTTSRAARGVLHGER
jgi:hypothetical protein